MTLPGTIKEVATQADSSVIISKQMELSFIDSPVYQPVYLSVSLHYYGSIGDTNYLGGGKYDAKTEKCLNFENNISEPQIIGNNLTCKFSFGDAGFSTAGYYIIDPSKKYILSVSENSNYSQNENFQVSLEDIVKSVHFFK